MQRQIEALRRKAEQGSQQLQGEALELELESLLRARFPHDRIEPVPKGEFGGNVLHRVVGSIFWESKRTRNWIDGWLPKLRDAPPRPKSPFLSRAHCRRTSRHSIWSIMSGWQRPLAIAPRESLIISPAAVRYKKARRPRWR